MAEWIIGQRCLSQTEPELGLGIVLETDARTVRIHFPATGTTRQYTLESAPLQRVRFRRGDQIRNQHHQALTVERVAERDGLIVYAGTDWELPETELSDLLSFSQPQERLQHGQLDDSAVFDLRLETWRQQNRLRKSGLRGFLGGRISLIPHQLYIAHEVASRLAPRILLADEVGLGKTIEACLILHRLLLTGQVGRILIVVPEPLLHQWFVELLRRFNLTFRLFDEERCAAIEANQPGINPFLDDQLILAALPFLANDPKRCTQVIEAGWDLVIVDEAHHLGWTPQASSPSYDLIEALARRADGLLLLTATPEQLGETGHFARLRLLDPDRYYDHDAFLDEAAHYQKVARVVDKILQGKRLTKTDTKLFEGETTEFNQLLAARAAGDEQAGQELIDNLLDRHGTGRVMFRNTRATMTGFPKRALHPAPLKLPDDHSAWLKQLREEFQADLHAGDPTQFEPDWEFESDPRLVWLLDLLRKLPTEKILLICRTRSKVEAIESALRTHMNVKAGLFHEDMTLLQRDRSAAWFAEEDGARILLCSEIGSEGRNFQFAHHLVLFDLPPDPGLLEQRIGRLDRIGQTSTINIHVPFCPGTPQEILFRWFQEGLNGFEQSLHDAPEVFEKFGNRVRELALKPKAASAALTKLLQETRHYHQALSKRLALGRDHLLELSSFRRDVADQVASKINSLDQDPALETFVTDIFDHFGIQAEPLSPRTLLLGAGDLQTDAIPALPPEGMVVTCDRARALEREDIAFLSWDHPIVTGVMDLLLGSPQGTSTFALWETNDPPALFLEALFVLECPAPEELHIDRFLPPTPIRVLVNHRLTILAEPARFNHLRDGSLSHLLSQPEITQTLLPKMAETAQADAEKQTTPILQNSLEDLEHRLGHELTRLQALRQVNPNVRQDEIDRTEEQLRTIREHLAQARLRLDALRLIWKGPAR